MAQMLARYYVDAEAHRDGTPSGEALMLNQKNAALERAKVEGCYNAFWDKVRDLRGSVD